MALLKYLAKPLENAGFNCGCISNRCGNKQRILGSGNQITLIISNDDIQDLLKLLQDSGILLDNKN